MGGCQGTMVVLKIGTLDNSVPVPHSNPAENDGIHYSNNIEVLERRVPRLSYADILYATHGLRDKLGEGSYGTVYLGNFQGQDGVDKNVAIKVRMSSARDRNFEWKREVNYLGQLNHPNIVKVIGFCSEDERNDTCKIKHRAIVYEYMPNGSLDKHIYSSAEKPLTWFQRMKIALDIAKGLDFIHSVSKPIILRDLKTTDILLDEGFHAKISDFGFAKKGPSVQVTNPLNAVAERKGYLDPHYSKTGLASTKTDVYPFGVILLEMIAGRAVIDQTYADRFGNENYLMHDLVKFGYPKLIDEDNLWKLMDNNPMRKDLKITPPSIKKLAKIAYKCLDNDPKKRPNMSEIVEKLHRILVDLP